MLPSFQDYTSLDLPGNQFESIDMIGISACVRKFLTEPFALDLVAGTSEGVCSGDPVGIIEQLDPHSLRTSIPMRSLRNTGTGHLVMMVSEILDVSLESSLEDPERLCLYIPISELLTMMSYRFAFIDH